MKIELSIEYFEEDGAVVALCPELNVSSFGESADEAEQSVKEALELFLEGCETQNTLHVVLEEAGFQNVNGTWVPRKPIKTTKTVLQHIT